jgi:sulfate transport system substrate-binding protein
MIRARRSRALALVLVGVAMAAAVGCSNKSDTNTTASAGTTPGGSTPATVSGTLNLVAYSTPQTAYGAIEKKFNSNGNSIKVNGSYGASGDQSRAVEQGQAADYVAFSLETDMTRLVKAKIVADDWNKNQYKGMVTDSVVVFVVRKDNPKGIKTWDDLTKPGVEIVTPNPFSSGAARWNILAGYGAKSNKGKDQAAGTAYLKSFFDNVVVQDDSGRKALQTFTGGKGDVLLSYENEAIFAQQQGEDIDYVVPADTILIENPAAVTANAQNAAVAKAWLAYLYTPEAQKIFADNGYRPVVKGVVPDDQFPTPTGLFTIQDLGGWDSVTKTFFDTNTGVVTQIEKDKGVATSK